MAMSKGMLALKYFFPFAVLKKILLDCSITKLLATELLNAVF